MILVQTLLRWCANVVQGWESPNPALLANGALPLSVYVEMIYQAKKPARRGAQTAVANILKALKPTPELPEYNVTDDIDGATLRKNFVNFARRSPRVYSPLRRKLRALHQFAAKR